MTDFKNGSPELIRKQIMYKVFDLARASALLQHPKESRAYKLGIERCVTAINVLKNVLEYYPETLSPNESEHIKQIVLIHELKDECRDITSA